VYNNNIFSHKFGRTDPEQGLTMFRRTFRSYPVERKICKASLCRILSRCSDISLARIKYCRCLYFSSAYVTKRRSLSTLKYHASTLVHRSIHPSTLHSFHSLSAPHSSSIIQPALTLTPHPPFLLPSPTESTNLAPFPPFQIYPLITQPPSPPFSPPPPSPP
jgi:hypothetical protein